MRADVDPSLLRRSHLLGEHAEVHGVSAVIACGRTVYSAHPEVQRLRAKLPALKKRHDALVSELEAQGLPHASPITAARGRSDRTSFSLRLRSRSLCSPRRDASAGRAGPRSLMQDRRLEHARRARLARCFDQTRERGDT